MILLLLSQNTSQDLCRDYSHQHSNKHINITKQIHVRNSINLNSYYNFNGYYLSLPNALITIERTITTGILTNLTNKSYEFSNSYQIPCKPLKPSLLLP